MDKRTKTKMITTVICLIISVTALFVFVFSNTLLPGWKIALSVLSLFWILSGTLNLFEYFKKGK